MKPSTAASTTAKAADHLVVLSHGIFGGPSDLSYLASLLRNNGCDVLTSSSNQLLRSTRGVESGGKALAAEVLEMVNKEASYKSISFVGNSLGGLYARYAIRELYSEVDHSIAGLEPRCFMTIATPHLGVKDHIYLEDELKFPVPQPLKNLVSLSMFATGKDMFEAVPKPVTASVNSNSNGNGNSDNDNAKLMTENNEQVDADPNAGSAERSLLYRMSVDDHFIKPLSAFKKRRLYANLQGDFMVPLGTAAFLGPSAVRLHRETYNNSVTITSSTSSTSSSESISPIVARLISRSSTVYQESEVSSSSVKGQSSSSSSIIYSTGKDGEESEEKYQMRTSLDRIGWEKVLVNFRNILSLPMSHNKICAITKFGNIIDKWLGFPQGREVMQDAANWISNPV